MRSFDTHCHLTWQVEGDPPEERWARARAAGVTAALCVAIDEEDAVACRALAAELPGVIASAGLHPNDLGAEAELDARLDRVAALLDEGGFHAVGETGLDRYRDRTPLALQVHALRRHLALAKAHDLPVILHCRDAIEELLAVLREDAPHRGVMHCYSSGPEWVPELIDLGLHVSFAGNLTYKRSEPLREAARLVPTERLLVETDAPFLTPQPKRGRDNEPAFVRFTLETLAETRGVSSEELAEDCFLNAARLFRFPVGAVSGQEQG